MRTGHQDILFHQYFLQHTSTTAANWPNRNVFVVCTGKIPGPVLGKWDSHAQNKVRNHLSDNMRFTVYVSVIKEVYTASRT